MRIGIINEGFALLPHVNINWYHYENKRHYYVQCAWLFWYLSTLGKFAWEK